MRRGARTRSAAAGQLPGRAELWIREVLHVEQQDAIGGIDHDQPRGRALDRSIRCDAVRKAVAEGRDVCAFRFRVVAPGGAIVHLEANARIFCDERGEPLRILGVSWDITEQVLQEERRRDLQIQLREASRLRWCSQSCATPAWAT